MGRLSNISSNPTLVEYAQGAAQNAIAPVADFLAPTVGVSAPTGKYKVYSEKNRFKLPDTRRAIGGKATEVGWAAADATYDCSPNAIDCPVDILESMAEAQLQNSMMEAAGMVADIAALRHEVDVISAAADALGAGTDVQFSSDNIDPVDMIDQAILEVVKAAKYGSLMGVGVLFGSGAWRLFKNNKNIKGSLVANQRSNVARLQPTDAGGLFIAQPETRVSLMVQDTAVEGKSESVSFLMDMKVIVFARRESPNRRDPSFMKTFRLMGQWMVPGSYVREDGRAEVAKFDWSEDIQVTNSAAGKLLNIK